MKLFDCAKIFKFLLHLFVGLVVSVPHCSLTVKEKAGYSGWSISDLFYLPGLTRKLTKKKWYYHRVLLTELYHNTTFFCCKNFSLLRVVSTNNSHFNSKIFKDRPNITKKQCMIYEWKDAPRVFLLIRLFLQKNCFLYDWQKL